MDAAGSNPDDLDVRLRWPESEDEASAPPYRGGSRSERVDTAPGQDVTSGPGGPEQLPLGSELVRSLSPASTRSPATADGNHAALAAIALRLDALTSATALLRNSVNDRLTEYGEQALRVQAASGRDLEDYRRLHDRSLTEIDAGLTASEEALHRLERATTDAITDLDRISRHFDSRLDRVQELVTDVANAPAPAPTDLGPVLDHIGGLAEQSDRVSAQLGALLGRPEPDLTAVRDGLGEVLAEVQDFSRRPEPVATDLSPVLETLDAVQDALERLAVRPETPPADLTPVEADLALLRDSMEDLAARPAPPPTDLTPVQEGLAAVQRTVEQLAAQPDPEPLDVGPILEILEDVRAGMEELARRPEALAADRASLDERLSHIQHTVEQIGSQEAPAIDLIPIQDTLDGIQAALDHLANDLPHVADTKSSISPEDQAQVLTGLDRVERALTAMAASVVGPDTSEAALGELNETIGRLSEAQAEDLERVLDSVEDVATTQTNIRDAVQSLATTQQAASESQSAALIDLGERLKDELARASAPTMEVDRSDLEAVVRQVASEIVERLDATTFALIDEVQSVTKSVDALRRRIAVRVRREPELSEAAVAAIADAVARQVSAGSPSVPRQVSEGPTPRPRRRPTA
jgi:hypothetical protein